MAAEDQSAEVSTHTKDETNTQSNIEREGSESRIGDDVKEESPPKFRTSKYPNLLKVIHMGFSFLLLFTSYTTTQSFVTSLFPDYGTYALAMVYFFFAFGGFLAPYVLSRLGIRLTFVLSSSVYVLFILSVALRNVYFFLIAAAVVGLHAAFLWAASGLYITLNSEKHTRGFYSGVFNAIFSSSGIVGSAITGGLLQVIETRTVIYILVGVSAASVVSFSFLRPPPKSQTDQTSTVTIKGKIIGTFKCLVDRRMKYLLLYMFYQGFATGIIFGKVVNLLEFKFIPFFILSYAFALTTSAFSYGKVYDSYGWIPIVVANFLSATIGFVLLFIGQEKDSFPLIFVCSFIFGHQDGLVALLMQSTVMTHFSDRAADAYSVYRTSSSIGSAVLLGIGKLLPLWILQIIVYSLMLVAVALYVVFQRSSSKSASVIEVKDGSENVEV